jgi:hypothetical protein
MEIRNLNFAWDESYSIFASPAYLGSQSDRFGWIGGYEDGALRFVLPYAEKRKAMFRYLSFQTETITIDPPAGPGREREFLERTLAHLKGQGFDFIIQPPTHVVFDTAPAGAVHAPFGTYSLDLSLSEEDLWKGMHQKHRNVVRNAEKSGVTVDMGIGNLRAAFGLVRDTMARSAMGFYGETEFMDMAARLGDRLAVFTAFAEGRPQGCAMFPYSRQGAYYSFGGSIEKPELGAMNLLHWTAIRHFKAAGVAKYDFVGARIKPAEGSKLEGIQRFKSRFGATLRTGMLWKCALKREKYYFYRLLQKAKGFPRPSSTGDIIDQELARNG